MKAYRRTLKALIVAVTLSRGALWGQSQIESLHEQKKFDAKYDDQIGQYNADSIPPEIRKLLSEDTDVRQAYRSRYLGGWFSPELKSIANPGDSLYLATWEGVLAGVPGNTFWLVKNEKGRNKPTVIFKATADRLIIGEIDASGYPEITTSQQTSTSRTDSTFRFEAGKYVLFRQYGTPHYQEQKSFNADDDDPAVHHPVPIPAAVFEILSKDDEFVQEALADHGWAIDQSPKNGWLTAGLVSKKNPSGELYLVAGDGGLAGAHGTTFWLVKNGEGENKPKILLKITADSLDIGKIGTSGYPVITASFIEATMPDEVFHFVAGRYRLLKTQAK